MQFPIGIFTSHLHSNVNASTRIDSSYPMLNIGYVSNEINTDVRMYIEEFILVEIWIHWCTCMN